VVTLFAQKAPGTLAWQGQFRIVMKVPAGHAMTCVP
jgi:hypothetical protein